MKGLVALIFALLIAAIVGVGAYQLGLSQGIATTGTGAAPVAPYYYHPFYGGFGFFGFLFPILFIFLIFGLLRSAFWGWGGRYGTRYGGRERLEELHRELHERPQGGDSGATPPPTGR